MSIQHLPAHVHKSSGTKISVFLSKVQQYCVFGQFKGAKVIFDESLVSAWQLHKLHLCLPSSLTSCTAPRPSTHTQRQTLFRCSLNSAAPLTLYLYTSCTQTLNKVNTQGSTLNTKQWHTQTLSQPSRFTLNISFMLCYQKSTGSV